jgi:LysR family nitrogen assimilation transcriptional regulator
MSHLLDLRRLRYFRTIAEAGSLSAAARSLRVAQPALSHHVRELERQLGPLFVRRNNGVTLTRSGELLYAHACDLLDRVEKAEADLLALAPADGSVQRLRLTIISSIAADLTPALLIAFRHELPQVTVRITESGTVDSHELIVANEADLAISLAKTGRSTLLAWEQLHLINAASDKRSSDIGVADLLTLPLILPARGNPLRELLEAAADRAGGTLNVVLEIDGAASRVHATIAAQGYTVLGHHSIADASRLPGVTIHRLAALRRPIYLDVRRGLPGELVQRAHRAVASALSSLPSLEVLEQGP